MSELLDHILYFLCLYLNWLKMLLGDNVGVVFCLDTGLNHKLELNISGFFVSDAKLVASSSEWSELISKSFLSILWKKLIRWLIIVMLTSKSSYFPFGSDTDKTNSVVSELTSITAIMMVNNHVFYIIYKHLSIYQYKTP